MKKQALNMIRIGDVAKATARHIISIACTISIITTTTTTTITPLGL